MQLNIKKSDVDQLIISRAMPTPKSISHNPHGNWANLPDFSAWSLQETDKMLLQKGMMI